MSLSINTPAFVNVDNGHLDQPSQTPAKLNVPSVANTPLQNIFNVPKGDITVDAGTLNKLFDMLELVFKALREMFAGKQAKSSVLPGKADLPATKLDAGKQPSSVKADGLSALNAEVLKQPSGPDKSQVNKLATTGTTGTPDAKVGDMPALVREALKQTAGIPAPTTTMPGITGTPDTKAGEMPGLVSEALKQQAGPVASTTPRPPVTSTLGAKAGDLPALVSEALKRQPGLITPLKTRFDTADSHDGNVTDSSVTTRGALRPQLGSLLPQALKPEVSVTNDARANVHVNVNIDHCHCPETGRPLDKGVQAWNVPNARVLPTRPALDVKPENTPHTEHGVTPETKLQVKPNLTPETIPHTEYGATPETKLHMKQHLTPETVPHTEHDVTPGPKLGSTANLKPETALHTDHDEVPQPVLGGVPQQLPDEKKVDITGPGPAEDQADQRDWRSGSRTNFTF